MIKVLRTGSHICIVDKGRFGYQQYGVPQGGAMDLQSAFAANSLVNNPIDFPVLELYQAGHQFEFLSPHLIALTGAQANITLNDEPIKSNTSIHIEKGSILTIGKLTQGVRMYMSIYGKIQTQSILNSCSPIPSVFPTTVKMTQNLEITNKASHYHSNTNILPTKFSLFTPLLYTSGPESRFLSEEAQNILSTGEFIITKYNDRMGCKIEGPSITAEKNDILSSPVLPGTIQLLPSGQLIILMRDCQTTGGYPRVGQLYPQHINQLAQRSTGDTIVFQRLDI